jgi:hypothetical protein
MSMTREQMAELVADVVAEHFQRLRADLMERMLQLRAPRFALTLQGELYVDGERVGDIRPVFRDVVAEALKKQAPTQEDDNGR